MSESATGERTITYFVNGEPETTEERELTVGAILESAELTPVTDYALASENPPEDYDSNYAETVKVHPNQRFRALFKGPTPVS